MDRRAGPAARIRGEIPMSDQLKIEEYLRGKAVRLDDDGFQEAIFVAGVRVDQLDRECLLGVVNLLIDECQAHENIAASNLRMFQTLSDAVFKK